LEFINHRDTEVAQRRGPFAQREFIAAQIGQSQLLFKLT